ncbi:response regulator [Aliiroseovarius sp.]|uniref:response regulator n=1 Tax=Aliiroseovarius sp. TaxID=1872442 RepID=UPI002633D33B|nr:response regulator [Aliiroseovarius sp.]
MRVLIVESNQDLGGIWKQHLERQDAEVRLMDGEESAVRYLTESAVDVIVLNLDLARGGALTVADFAAYRHPDAKVIFVTASSFFSDGSIFAHSANACACLSAQTAPEDLATLVSYHGQAGTAAAE